MNIDISNAHCGFRTLSVTHAWPRVARHSNPPGRRLTPADGRAWTRAAGGRVHARPIGGGVSSRFAKRNARRPRRRRSPRGFADPARRFHSSSSARTVVSSRAAAPPGAGGAVGGGPVPAAEPGGPSNDVGVVPALGASLSSARTACVPAPRLAVHGRRGGGRGRIACATSDQVRLPAEFKHISKRRKRN